MTTIAQFIVRLQRMQKPEFRQLIAQKLGDEMVRQIGIGFDTRSDPYGNYWAARQRSYPWPILEKTGALRASYRIVSVGPDHVRVASNSPYAGFHQFATVNLPFRRMIPVATRGLGVWGARLKYLAAQEIRSALLGQ